MFSKLMECVISTKLDEIYRFTFRCSLQLQSFFPVEVRRNSICANCIKMLLRYCRLIFFLLCSFISFASVYKFPFQDPKLPWDERVDDLVSRLTLQEMVNQSLAICGIERLSVQPYSFSTECLHGYVDRNATAFPQSINLAASFR